MQFKCSRQLLQSFEKARRITIAEKKQTDEEKKFQTKSISRKTTTTNNMRMKIKLHTQIVLCRELVCCA